MKRLLLVRHAHAQSNDLDIVSSEPPGLGLSSRGRDEARALGAALHDVELDLGVVTEFSRTQETLAIAVAGRALRVEVDDGLNEIAFGAYDGGPLAAYRCWAWATGPADDCPGGGESRVDAALRWASALDRLLARSEETIVAVTHALPLRYVIDGSDGVFPAARMAPVAHATPFAFTAEEIATAVRTLRDWVEAPRFVDAEPETS